MESTIISRIDERFDISRRIEDNELPTVVYALAGAFDVVRHEVELTPQRVESLRGRVIDLGERVAALPDTLEDSAETFVSDLRHDTVQRYKELARRGEKSVNQAHAERVITHKVEKVTPAAAKASVSAKATAKKVTQSPTGKKTAAATKRASAATKRAVTSVTEVPAEAVAEATEAK